ncbi:hypothetical protein ENSA5_54070 [Enhygromyxa salina]|uniref:Uncharacterized protein n=1 Tax=Enhygromyxa salina TaxID=215803 RepID=A0A2S9XFM6_9BACT|nr:Rho termination factor N-terminal domain-containing protein [Enhygromyxa salina]PRP91647.1 hypothetical protein ENSA5_54070 [Enhygromyxa salina]
MAKISSFLAGAAIGAAAGATAGVVLRPHLRTLAKTAISGYYLGKRHALELASLVSEELEDLHAEVLDEWQTANSSGTTVSADASSDHGVDAHGAGEASTCAPPQPENAASAEPSTDQDEAQTGATHDACVDGSEAGERELETMTVSELRDALIKLGVQLGTRMRKAELITQLRSLTHPET